ncbi:hypothetical protein ACWDWO_13415 [Actinopolymorpha singaporensis]|uniref:Uncharacterized protein n=1 Tax=Actinopolymorpha singaporensis TaxID=117157 RepID=A0A1H1UWQ6_9ACTN|nr:hypothetical protein [Actinopolymorpha singaporensis]SDS77018.1 hypothetical protein SAMN04489717_3811 [Actinopolymorpha singaporensis]
MKARPPAEAISVIGTFDAATERDLAVEELHSAARALRSLGANETYGVRLALRANTLWLVVVHREDMTADEDDDLWRDCLGFTA